MREINNNCNNNQQSVADGNSTDYSPGRSVLRANDKLGVKYHTLASLELHFLIIMSHKMAGIISYFIWRWQGGETDKATSLNCGKPRQVEM